MICFNFEAQNLIKNPSFEDIDSCYGYPAGIGFDVFMWSGCTGWTCPTIASSDLWCDNPVYGPYAPPSTGFGFQYPRSGKKMSGLFVYVRHEEYREYIQNELVKELAPNTFYNFKIFVSNSYYEELSSGSSCLEVFFSKSPIVSGSWLTLPVTPQLKNDNSIFLIDTLDWISVTGIFKATGGEKYVTIGCFQDDSKITLTNELTDTTGSDIYYYLDDAELFETAIVLEIPNVFTPNNDGVNDLYQPNVINIPDWKMEIVNRWGESLVTLDEQHSFWYGKNADDGVYFYKFWSEEFKILEQGFISLIR